MIIFKWHIYVKMSYTDNLISLQQMHSGVVDCIAQHIKNPPKPNDFGGLNI